jgi:NitT/TauT family transport system permease protein
MQRAAVGYGAAVLIGSLVGAVVSRISVLRRAVGSMITGLQTMPSIAWFPLAILLFTLSERAIAFVVILGAAPSIANGLITGIDHVPPLLLRSGKMLGARRFGLYRHVILPASLPSYVAGLKQGWAFAWRSLMAGELLVVIAGHPSIGTNLSAAREFVDAPWLYSTMIVIFILGVVADSLFGRVDLAIRRRWGLLESAG